MRHVLDVSVILESTRLAFEGRMPFPQVVAALAKSGVERYQADLTRLIKTHYSACGHAVSDSLPLVDAPEPAEAWSEEGVKAAIRAAQQGEIQYPEFLRRILAAGCVAYWVFIAGRQAMYLGRRGEVHVELFPRQR
ncbi:MAG TPA: DUF1398 domain-containing protein [Phycisphaerae bacterium]|nr:DUF1398 domain-containing protein [Phycisphaerae bacterium]